MKLYKDIETSNILTEEQLKKEFEVLKAEDSETYNYTFNEYINNCTSKNGTLEEVKNNYIFTFEWVHGNRCINDYIIEWLKRNKINFQYKHFELVADVYGINRYLSFDYEKINGDLYGVFIKK